METRASRTQDDRAMQDLHGDMAVQYEYSGNFPQIAANPGMEQRWVRTAVRGENDHANVYKQMNKGWRVRLRDSVPKDQFIPTVELSGSEVIGIHGMVLMERPKAVHQKFAEINREAANAQMSAADNDILKSDDPGRIRVDKPKRSTKVSRGAVVPDDD